MNVCISDDEYNCLNKHIYHTKIFKVTNAYWKMSNMKNLRTTLQNWKIKGREGNSVGIEAFFILVDQLKLNWECFPCPEVAGEFLLTFGPMQKLTHCRKHQHFLQRKRKVLSIQTREKNKTTEYEIKKILFGTFKLPVFHLA